MTDVGRTLLGGVQVIVLFVLPLLVYLRRRNQMPTRVVFHILAIWALWYVSYSPTHEASHLLAGVLAGMRLASHQLTPPFWRGDFIHGYVTWQGGTRQQFLVMCMAPYVFDAVLLLIGVAIARHMKPRSPFVGALILALTCLRCVFDVSNNYAADTVFGGAGDFRFLFENAPPLAVHIGAWVLMVLGSWCAVHQILGPGGWRQDLSQALAMERAGSAQGK